jgi:signal transduction histidine kinase
MSNALEYGDGVVTVTAQRHAEAVSLSVHNDGAPIPVEVLSTVFEPFHRPGPQSHGLGLGLYIVREIVRAHGGALDVRSSATEGTTFQITLSRPSAGASMTGSGAAGRVEEPAHLEAVQPLAQASHGGG